MAAKGILRCGILMDLDSQPVKPLALRPAWDRRKQKAGAMEPKDKAFSDWKGSQEYLYWFIDINHSNVYNHVILVYSL